MTALDLTVETYVRKNFSHGMLTVLPLSTPMFAQYRLEAFFGAGGKIAELMQQFHTKLCSDEITRYYPHHFIPENVYANLFRYGALAQPYRCFLGCYYVHSPGKWLVKGHEPSVLVKPTQVYTPELDHEKDVLFLFEIGFNIFAPTADHGVIEIDAA